MSILLDGTHGLIFISTFWEGDSFVPSSTIIRTIFVEIEIQEATRKVKQ